MSDCVFEALPTASRGVPMRAADNTPTVLTPREARVLRALGQALFPRDRHIDVDAVDVDVTGYIDDWLSRCSTLERAQFHALVQTVDRGFSVWARDPSARIEAARADTRRAYVESWERSATYLQRMLWEGLRSMFLFAYVDASPVREAFGQDDPAREADAPGANPPPRHASTAEEPEQVARFVGGGCGARSLPKEG